MIILDLEWNRGRDEDDFDEILQIGAVRVERPGGSIAGCFDAYIRPQVHQSFDVGGSKPPDLRRCLDSDIAFPEAMERFRAWRGAERAFGFWGGGDAGALSQNCQRYGLPPVELPVEYDLQRAFCRTVGAKDSQIALWKAVEYCGIPDVFCYHNALNDAMYTALVCQFIAPAEMQPQPAAIEYMRRHRLSPLPFAEPSARPIPPQRHWWEVLDHPASRQPPCPVCGKNIWVAQWRQLDRLHYHTLFTCPEHGRFVARLTLSRDTDRGWLGSLTVPPFTKANLTAYERALTGRLYRCTPLRKRRS